MRVLFRVVFALAGLLAVAPATAAAVEQEPFPTGPAYSSSVTAASVQIAAEFWHADPCPAGQTFIVARLQSGYATPAGGAPLERVSVEYPCTILLSPIVVWRVDALRPDYQDDILECGLIVHAVGHQLGFDHDDDARSAMFGGALTSTVRRCYSHFKPRSVSRKRDRVLNERVWAQHPGSPILDHMVTP